MKKKLNYYDEPKIEILVLEVQDVITASRGDPSPFVGDEQDLTGFFGQRDNGFVD